MENKKEPLRILLADDHRVLRKGLSLLLSSEEDFSVVAEASDGEEALEKAAKTPVDIALLDLSMPRMGGLECLRRLKAMQPAVRVLILTMHSERQYVCECLRAGANGYLCKDTLDAELFRALRTVAAGGRYLGEREAELLIDGALEEPAAPRTHRARLLALDHCRQALPVYQDRIHLQDAPPAEARLHAELGTRRLRAQAQYIGEEMKKVVHTSDSTMRSLF